MGAIGRATLPTQGSADLLGLVLRHAHDRPLQLALKDDSESFNYAQLAERVASVAAGLTALGVVPGDRVALHLGNSAAFVTSALGCLWAGVPFVPLSPDSPPARLDQAIQDCDARPRRREGPRQLWPSSSGQPPQHGRRPASSLPPTPPL